MMAEPAPSEAVFVYGCAGVRTHVLWPFILIKGSVDKLCRFFRC